jgi:hypothetical protein
MGIDIDRLSEAELVDLNRRIVERLRLLAQMRAHAQMLEFKAGDRVTFRADGPAPVTGVLTRYNRRTVTVIADGRQWTVAPSLLPKAGPARAKTQSRPGSNVIALK